MASSEADGGIRRRLRQVIAQLPAQRDTADRRPADVASPSTAAATAIYPPKRPSPTGRWSAVLRLAQLLGLVGASVATVIDHPAAWLGVAASALVIGSAGGLFAVAAAREPPGSPTRPAWTLLAVALGGTAVVVLSWSGGGRPAGWSGSVAPVACSGAALLAVWLLLRGRRPRWLPSTGWDGSVVALAAAAISVALISIAQESGDATARSIAPAAANLALLTATLSAAAVATPAPRPRLRWLAAGFAAVSAADLLAIAVSGVGAIPDSDPAGGGAVVDAARLVWLGGFGLLGLAAASGTPGRRTDRRRRPGPAPDPITLPGAAAAAAIGLLGLDLVDPHVPPAASGLALACLGIALMRKSRELLEERRTGDPRARTDDLTGLANRRALSEALAGDGAETDRGSGWSGWAGWSDEIALLLVDLDRFKDVNEELGHAAGDQLLAAVGSRLRGALRPTQLLARLGGDEFAVVLPAAGAEQAQRVAGALRESLVEPFEIDGARLHVRASVGVATGHPSAGEPADLLRQADVAMYLAKATGSGIELYDPARDQQSAHRLRRIDELREALERGELEVHLQPQVDLHTGSIVGAEALARWRHPEDGVLLPEAFLPLAEQTGLMQPVAALVLDRALAACTTWWREFQLPVSVNLGAEDLRNPDMPDQVPATLRRHRLPAEALRVEITEQALLTDPQAVSAVLSRWRDDGVTVAIDDFGTGYSSLSYLRELPVDEVKLDRTFVADIHRRTTATIVRHTIAMAHGLWAKVVAEGIEDESTARALTDLGCDVGQGLYFGAATTAADFVDLLRSRAG